MVFQRILYVPKKRFALQYHKGSRFKYKRHNESILYNTNGLKNNCVLDMIGEFSISEAGHDNLYYMPLRDIHDLAKILYKIPLWTSVMQTHYNSANSTATSSGSESNFKTVKNLIMRSDVVRVDKFVKSHITYLSGEIKIAASKDDKVLEIKLPLRDLTENKKITPD